MIHKAKYLPRQMTLEGSLLARLDRLASATRRDVLKKTATLAATSALALSRGAQSVGGGGSGRSSWNAAVSRCRPARRRQRQDVPGVVAMAATETGVSVKGFLAASDIHEGGGDDARHDLQRGHLLGLTFLGVPLATFSALEGNQIGQSAKS
jgi:hypothetical protein